MRCNTPGNDTLHREATARASSGKQLVLTQDGTLEAEPPDMVKDAMHCTRCRRALPLEKVERSSARSGRRRPHWWKAGNAGARMAQDVKAAGVREGTCVLVGDELRSLGLAADAIEVGKNTSDASHAASLLGAAFGTSRSEDRRFQPESFPMCPSAWTPASASARAGILYASPHAGEVNGR